MQRIMKSIQKLILKWADLTREHLPARRTLKFSESATAKTLRVQLAISGKHEYKKD
jgi:hypothetical protein